MAVLIGFEHLTIPFHGHVYAFHDVGCSPTVFPLGYLRLISYLGLGYGYAVMGIAWSLGCTKSWLDERLVVLQRSDDFSL